MKKTERIRRDGGKKMEVGPSFRDPKASQEADDAGRDTDKGVEVSISGASLNLSKRNLRELPDKLLSLMHNVEGNKLSELPFNFFEMLHCLKWLDLRNNCLTALPLDGLKSHQHLEVILLQGNQIRNLPAELATIPTLRGLQTSGNPLVNVPYDAIADGFQGIMRHLKKLYSQELILLPGSDKVVVKPSTSQADEPDEKTARQKISELTDLELRKWDLDKLSQWRQFIKKKSKKLKENELQYHMQLQSSVDKRNSHPKISVSVRSQTKPPVKSQPFRCGLYNKNRKKFFSALRYRKMRRTQLGYKRKPLTAEMILEKDRAEAYRAQMRETLEKQAKKIQRMRDKEVLKSWRDHARISREQIKLLDNYQQYPAKNYANKTPFDVDPEFLHMLNRVDLYRSLQEYDSRSKRTAKSKERVTALDLEKQMNEIMCKLKELDTRDERERKSPRSKQSHMCNKIQKILDIQKTLKTLQTLNSSMSGFAPLVKPNIYNN